MKVISIDVGNTNTKLDIWENNSHIRNYIFHDAGEIAKEQINWDDVDGVCLSTVTKSDADSISEVIERHGLELIPFGNENVKEYVGNSYSVTLGADRLAAWLGAREHASALPVLIVDAGTALTIDVSDKDGNFKGGNISLGLSSRLKSLHEYTSRLPLVDKEGDVTLFAHDTVSAIRNGAVNGVIAEIEYYYDKIKNKYGDCILIITGGDAETLLPHLQRPDVNLIYDPYLVGRGLNFHFRMNSKKRFEKGLQMN